MGKKTRTKKRLKSDRKMCWVWAGEKNAFEEGNRAELQLIVVALLQEQAP